MTLICDCILIIAAIALALSQPWFVGGFGFFLLLGLSPRAWGGS